VMHLPDFYGPHADNSFANYFMREALRGKTASFIGPLDVEREFVYVPDVPEPLLALARSEDAYGQCWNLAGFSPITGRGFAQLVFDAVGRAPKYRSVPKLALHVFGLFNPFMREVAEMYYLYESGFILDDSKLRQRIGDVRKTPYQQGVRQTIEWMREHAAGAVAV
jgi:nucleoside-diphosphate-sugar epimerase